MGQTRKVVVATHNEGKLRELRRILDDLLADEGRRIELVSAGQLGLPDPVETGATFQENALLKAEQAARGSGLPALADDSGLVVDVMGAAPGILSARWSGRHGDDQANMDLLLNQLQDIPDDHRGGRFVCAAALVVPDVPGYAVRGRQMTRIGEMPGSIIRQPRGENGFGYDPIFVPRDQPQGSGKQQLLTTAEMTSDQKNAISHRGKALAAIMPVLISWVLGKDHIKVS
ncbi:RdgB/HAM1 family non-canonical purine NTP pyrophosphatase [Bifidobacterium asteroides]|uniref:dITP/XTP pyrophosphatase n=1 Tax=Bifidobacterium asteroides TaxID=1684 RepID=A0A318MC27_9BIFI|nr:RdgB/HAM1 family non-canonical purine NTP pyrophosphatase [Bifidobacterium asteroides]PXY85862.1 non-canonical purine NTP pyrophosphatase, RdgB/HAM1 family [Bifidobacterium asteroides]